MSTDDKRIREFAYQIWESEGRPEGHEARHWEMARKLAEAEALAPGNKVKVAPSKASARSATASAVEKPAAPKKPRAPRKPPAI